MAIQGTKVKRPSKAELASDIAQLCGISNPYVSNGSSVDSAFVDNVYEALTGDRTGATGAYRRVEKLLTYLGRPYDPFWDTSESAQTGGGSTVTSRAYSRVRTALSGRPRCFIINVTDAPVGSRWERDHRSVYRYAQNVTGQRSLNDAGPESRVIYYSTKKSTSHGMKFIAHATVQFVDPGWVGPWTAKLGGYEELPDPVPVSDVEIAGWNRQHSITEITYETWCAIVARGGGVASTTVTFDAGDDERIVRELQEEGEAVADRVRRDFDPDMADPVIEVPSGLPSGQLVASPVFQPTYVETEGGTLAVDQPALRFSRATGSERNKLAEVRAVELAQAGIEAEGWELVRDCQKDGVGYDLEFGKSGRRLKVEVKGVQGPDLTFNLTPKELWRAETDEDWVLVAVTSVLSPYGFTIHLVTRDRVLEGRRVVTGYRIAM